MRRYRLYKRRCVIRGMSSRASLLWMTKRIHPRIKLGSNKAHFEVGYNYYLR